MKHGMWLVGLSNSQVLHLLIGQWSDKPGNIGTVGVTVYHLLLDRGLIRFKDVVSCLNKHSDSIKRIIGIDICGLRLTFLHIGNLNMLM